MTTATAATAVTTATAATAMTTTTAATAETTAATAETTAATTTATTAATAVTTTTASTAPAALDAVDGTAKLKNSDLFQVLISQINKLCILIGEFILGCLVVTMFRVHKSFLSFSMRTEHYCS
jgi:hypothetical protein